MGQGGGLDDLRIDPMKRRCLPLVFETVLSKPPADLSYLEAVLLPCVKKIGLASPDNLGDTSQPLKGRRVMDAVAILAKAGSLVVRAELERSLPALVVSPGQLRRCC